MWVESESRLSEGDTVNPAELNLAVMVKVEERELDPCGRNQWKGLGNSQGGGPQPLARLLYADCKVVGVGEHGRGGSGRHAGLLAPENRTQPCSQLLVGRRENDMISSQR